MVWHSGQLVNMIDRSKDKKEKEPDVLSILSQFLRNKLNFIIGKSKMKIDHDFLEMLLRYFSYPV